MPNDLGFQSFDEMRSLSASPEGANRGYQSFDEMVALSSGDGDKDKEKQEERRSRPKIGAAERLRLERKAETGDDASTLEAVGAQLTLGVQPVVDTIRTSALQQLASGKKKTFFRGEVPFSELPDYEVSNMAKFANLDMPLMDSPLKQWDKTRGAEIADPKERRAARAKFIQSEATNELKRKLQNKIDAGRELSGRDKTLWAKLGGGFVNNAGYTGAFMVGAPMAIGTSVARRFGDLQTDEQTLVDGEIVTVDKGDAQGTAMSKGAAGGTAEYLIEKYGTEAAGAVLKGTFGKIPFVGAALSKAGGTAVGKTIANVAKKFNRLGEITGKQNLAGEIMAEELPQQILDAGLGLDKRESAKLMGIGSDTAESFKSFVKPENVGNMALEMLLMQSVQGTAAGVSYYDTYSKDRNRVDGTLAAFGADPGLLKKASLQEKREVLATLGHRLTPEKATLVLERLGNKADGLYKSITEQEGYDFDAKKNGIASKFRLPPPGSDQRERLPDGSMLYDHAESGIGIVEHPDGRATVYDRDGDMQEFKTLGEAVKSAHGLSVRNQVIDMRRGQKAKFVEATARRLSPGVKVQVHNTAEDLLEAVPEVAQSPDYSGDDMPGVAFGDTIHVVLDNIKTPRGVVSTILHEAGVHAGLNNVLKGEAKEQFLANLGAGEIDKYKSLAGKMGYLEWEHTAEEALAYMYEQRLANPTGYQRAVKWTHDRLRKVNPNYKFTDSDIEVMMADAQRSVKAGAGGISLPKAQDDGLAKSAAYQNAAEDAYSVSPSVSELAVQEPTPPVQRQTERQPVADISSVAQENAALDGQQWTEAMRAARNDVELADRLFKKWRGEDAKEELENGTSFEGMNQQESHPNVQFQGNQRIRRGVLDEGMRRGDVEDNPYRDDAVQPGRKPRRPQAQPEDNRGAFDSPKEATPAEAEAREMMRGDRLQRRMDQLSEQSKGGPEFRPIVGVKRASEKIAAVLGDNWNDMSVEERRTLFDLRDGLTRENAGKVIDALDMFVLDLQTRPYGAVQESLTPEKGTSRSEKEEVVPVSEAAETDQSGAVLESSTDEVSKTISENQIDSQPPSPAPEVKTADVAQQTPTAKKAQAQESPNPAEADAQEVVSDKSQTYKDRVSAVAMSMLGRYGSQMSDEGAAKLKAAVEGKADVPLDVVKTWEEILRNDLEDSLSGNKAQQPRQEAPGSKAEAPVPAQGAVAAKPMEAVNRVIVAVRDVNGGLVHVDKAQLDDPGRQRLRIYDKDGKDWDKRKHERYGLIHRSNIIGQSKPEDLLPGTAEDIVTIKALEAGGFRLPKEQPRDKSEERKATISAWKNGLRPYKTENGEVVPGWKEAANGLLDVPMVGVIWARPSKARAADIKVKLPSERKAEAQEKSDAEAKAERAEFDAAVKAKFWATGTNRLRADKAKAVKDGEELKKIGGEFERMWREEKAKADRMKADGTVKTLAEAVGREEAAAVVEAKPVISEMDMPMQPLTWPQVIQVGNTAVRGVSRADFDTRLAEIAPMVDKKDVERARALVDAWEKRDRDETSNSGNGAGYIFNAARQQYIDRQNGWTPIDIEKVREAVEKAKGVGAKVDYKQHESGNETWQITGADGRMYQLSIDWSSPEGRSVWHEFGKAEEKPSAVQPTVNDGSVKWTPENQLLTVADRIETLRATDVYRLLSETPEQYRYQMRDFINKGHSDNQRIQDEVRKAMKSLTDTPVVTEKADAPVDKVAEKWSAIKRGERVAVSNDDLDEIEKRFDDDPDIRRLASTAFSEKSYEAFLKPIPRREDTPGANATNENYLRALTGKLKPDAVPSDPATTTAVQVETAPDGDKTVSVPSKDTPAISTKEQKKFLLAEIDKAIEAAPDEAEESGNWSQAQEEEYKAADKAHTKAVEYRNFSTIDRKEFVKRDDAVKPLEGVLWKLKEKRNLTKYVMVSIEVPGDGTFTIINDKTHLSAFRDKAKKRFPASMFEPADNEKKALPEPHAPVRLGRTVGFDAMTAEIKALLQPFASTDPTRKLILNPHWNGAAGEAVATDGRRLAVMIGKKNAKPKKDDSGYPNYGQSIPAYKAGKVPDPDKADALEIKVDSEKLARKLTQALSLYKDVEKASPTVKLWLTADGKVEVTTEFSETRSIKDTGGSYSSLGDTPGFELGIYNPEYLMDALTFLRKTGNETPVMRVGGKGSPMLLAGKSEYVIQMPLRVDDSSYHYNDTHVAEYAKWKSKQDGTLDSKGRTPEQVAGLRKTAQSAKAEAPGGESTAKGTEPKQDATAEKADAKPAPSAKPPGKLEDFGEKIGGARKDVAPSVEKEITDDDIANMSFSEIWPKSEVDAIEDTDMAALATALRNDVTAKPRTGYKVKRWVESVKLVRSLMKYANDKGFDAIVEQMKAPEYRALGDLVNKVNLLRQLPRDHWNRIGNVRNHPDAMRYEDAAENEPGAEKITSYTGKVQWIKNVPTPHATAEVDGRIVRAPSLDALVAAVGERLDIPAESASLQFEVRGKRDLSEMQINKKGDPLYRPLKKFTGKDSVQQARDFIRNNRADLVAAWEAVKESDNVKETDVRSGENRPRKAKDYRQGRDVTPEMFQSTFGFRGVEFGNWVSQGANMKERQGMLNEAFDALNDLADIIGVPTKAVSLNGELALGFGSRGHGWASAHYEPGKVVINLTKTRGAGSLAHEFFHAMDHYFQRKRPGGLKYDHEGNYITFQPETYYENEKTGDRLSARRFSNVRLYNPADWKRVEGVRPEVEEAFTKLVKALNDSPMSKRSALIDKGKSGGYWSRIIERAARAFEGYVISKMAQKGYHNDYLANVVDVKDFARDKNRYPYLLDEELAPVEKAFDELFATVKTKETAKGVAMFRRNDAVLSFQLDQSGAGSYDQSRKLIPVKEVPDEIQRAVGTLREGVAELLEPGEAAPSLQVVEPVYNAQTLSGKTLERGAHRALESVLRKRIVFVDGGDVFDGVTLMDFKDIIILNARAKTPLLQLLGHEISHAIGYDDPSLYAEMADKLSPLLFNSQKTLDDIRRQTGRRLTQEEVNDYAREMFAEALGQNFTDKEFWAKVAEHDKSLFERVADFIVKWIDDVLGKLNVAGIDVSGNFTDMVKARDILADALARYADGRQAVGEPMFRRSDAAVDAVQNDADYLKAVERGDMEKAQRMVDDEANGALKVMRERWQHENVSSFAYAKGGDITLHEIRMPKEQRGQGVGTSKMRELLELAQNYGMRVLLSPSTDFGASSKSRLEAFYRRFGFEKNSGRNRDYRTRETMIWRPEGYDKHADPVTRDDSGRVIPLSERFNDESNDIRFRRSDAEIEALLAEIEREDVADNFRALPSTNTNARDMQADVQVSYAYNLEPKTVQQMQDQARGIYERDKKKAQLDLLAGYKDKDSDDINTDAQRMATDKLAVDDMTMDAVNSPDDDGKAATAMLAIWRWYERGTDVARALRLRFDPVDTPEGRRAWIMRTLLAPTRAEAEIIRRAKTTNEAISALKAKAKHARASLKILRAKNIDISKLTAGQLMDDVYVAKIMQDISAARSGWGDVVHEWWRNAILSAPTTQIVNTVGNAGNAALEAFIQRPVEALINTYFKNDRAATFRSIGAMYRAIIPSMNAANKNFLKAWATEKPVTGDSAKVEESDAAIPDRFGGKTVRIPQRVMLATDEWFKTVFMAMLTADYATREFDRLVNEGKQQEANREAYVLAQVHKDSSAYAKAWEETLRWSFQQKPGHMAGAIMNWRNDPDFGFWLKFIFPFVKTPANIISSGLRKTPLNAVPYLYKASTGKYSQEDAFRLGAEQAVGMAFMSLLYMMMKGDDDDPLDRPRITGTRKASAFSPKGMKEAEMKDYPPMSVRVGDRWVSYKRLEPFATMASTMVDALTVWEQAKAGHAEDIPATVFSSIRGNLADKTFLQGVGNLVSIMEGDELAMSRAVTGTLAGFNPNIVRSTVRAFDPYIRETRTQEKGALKKFASRLAYQAYPAESNAPPPKIGKDGNPVEREGGAAYNALVPFSVQSADKTTKVDAMVKRYNERVPKEQRWWPSSPEPSDVTFGREKIRMTDEENAEYKRVAGQIAERRLSSISFNYSNPGERDIDRLKKVYEKSREAARDRMRPAVIRRWRAERAVEGKGE